MTDKPIWLTEADVVGLINLPEAIDALETTLALEAVDQAASMPKTHLMVAANDAMHTIGASVAGEGICGFKTWINVQGKSETTMTLFSMDDGACLAVIEASVPDASPPLVQMTWVSSAPVSNPCPRLPPFTPFARSGKSAFPAVIRIRGAGLPKA